MWLLFIFSAGDSSSWMLFAIDILKDGSSLTIDNCRSWLTRTVTKGLTRVLRTVYAAEMVGEPSSELELL